MSGFRANASVASAAVMTAGDGVPGGTNAVIFIDSADGNKLKCIFPNGDIYLAENSESGISFVNTNP